MTSNPPFKTYLEIQRIAGNKSLPAGACQRPDHYAH